MVAIRSPKKNDKDTISLLLLKIDTVLSLQLHNKDKIGKKNKCFIIQYNIGLC